MRTAIGLIGLGLIGGVVPSGLQGFTYALPVLAGTAGALTALVICCLASGRRHPSSDSPVALRWGLPFGPGRVVTRATSPSAAHSALGMRSPAEYRAESCESRGLAGSTVQVMIDRALDQRAIEMLAALLVRENGDRPAAAPPRRRLSPRPSIGRRSRAAATRATVPGK